MGFESKLSFGLNETLRLVVPGFFLLVLISAYLGVLDATAITLFSTEQFIAAGLALGFICYSFSYPTKRQDYKKGYASDKLLQFSRELAKQSGDSKIELNNKGNEHFRVYFYFLNNFFPETFHEVIMVTGGLYFCGTYLWFFAGLFALLGFCTLVVLLIVRHCAGITNLPVCGLHMSIDNVHLCYLGLVSMVELLVWFLLNPSRKLDRMMITLCNDQDEWFRLNSPLVEYILKHRTDPRSLALLKSAKNGSDGKDLRNERRPSV